MIDAVGLREKAKSRARSLSGGQRRRLDVALGIVGDPELLFLDEPTTGFDPQARRHFWDLIAGLAPAAARRSCSPRTTSTRPRSWPTGSASSRPVSWWRSRHPATLGGRLKRGATVVVVGRRRAPTRCAPTPRPPWSPTWWPLRGGAEVADLQVVRPTLEDVYLSMVGDAAEPVDVAMERIPVRTEGALR